MEVRKARGALEAAVLVEHDPFADQRRPGQEISETGRGMAVFGEVHHGHASDREMARNAQMPAANLDKERIALCCPDGGEMADRPDEETDQP